MKHVIHPQVFAGLGYEQRQEIVLINTFDKGELHCVMQVVCEVTQVTEDEFFSTRKFQDIIMARMIFSLICREILQTRVKLLGKFLKRDHSTIVSNTKTAKGLLKVDKSFNHLYHRCLSTAESKLDKYGFEHTGLHEGLRSQVRTVGSATSGASQRLVFTQTSSR